MNILLGVTGSVAAIYTTQFVNKLKQIGTVKVILTPTGDEFSNVEHVHSDVYTEADEHWKKNGDQILHIELRKWADIMVIAPLSANTMAKITNGICDNMLTQVVRAWDFTKPILLCPAMNTYMWDSPITDDQVIRLTWNGFHVMEPIVKTLACGDTGIGALPTHESIMDEVIASKWSYPLKKDIFIPIGDHPGAFGTVRKHDVHTGVDLYCNDGDEVHAMEDGIVKRVLPFTGQQIGMDWWEDTSCILVRGKYGTVNYGEVTPLVKAKQVVKRGDVIAKVKRVLKKGRERPDIPHHSLCMLHVEYYRNWVSMWEEWSLDAPKPKNLLDPTNRLLLCQN